MNLWIPIIITLALSAVFSGMEIAFVTANKLKIEVDKNKDLMSAKILSRFQKKPSMFIGALLLGNNVALVIYGIYIVRLLETPILQLLPYGTQSEVVVLIIQTLISTLLILFFAEFLPKVLFRINPNNILNVLAVPVYIFFILFYPVIVFFIGISEFLLRYLFKVNITQPEYSFGVIDLDHFVNDSSAHEPSENDDYQAIQMFQNALDLGNIKLRECLIPRNEIVALSQDESTDTLCEAFITSGHSKILIYQDSIDNIIGYTHSYDLFKKPESVKSITKPVLIVPETMQANRVLNMFMQERKSVALVVDEFGGTAGMVTMEDIIEEIFGEIDDEFDVEDLIENVLDENEFLFSGRLEIDYLNQKYKLGLPETDDYETLAGYIIHHYENIPSVKDEIQIGNYLFTIVKATDTRIEEVLIRINPS